ncbi:PREDICTED: CD209 antigen-like protein C isoform X4 [Myotis brandtii]|uniref:CD209 antigen-like protein C isoform X4 n=1 Tax=Myotis brandtii TaxID=109478 RepID=UPI0007040032|nr:PREDICTED: CD209 antigen-like protein C isoform X4 [Myotis brandtii]
MAEMCVPKEPGGPDEAEPPLWGNGGEARAPGSWGSPEEREIFQGQRSSEKDPGLSRSSRSLPVSRIQQSLPREVDDQESHSPVVVLQSDLEEILHQLSRMNATLTGLCRRCPWNWDFFQGSCYIFSKIQSTWDASVSACEDMRAQLVVINNAEEQKFLKSWDIRNDKITWIGLSDKHNEGSWQWVDNTHLHLSFWKKGEPNNQGEEDCVELSGDGWNDNKCSEEHFWICEKPSALCPGL